MRSSLRLVLAAVMVDLFCVQVFRWGWVHCDPHPWKTYLYTRVRTRWRSVVATDHGLYVKLTPEFRRQYSELWKALPAMGIGALVRVARQWGVQVGAPDLFARCER